MTNSQATTKERAREALQKLLAMVDNHIITGLELGVGVGEPLVMAVDFSESVSAMRYSLTIELDPRRQNSDATG